MTWQARLRSLLMAPAALPLLFGLFIVLRTALLSMPLDPVSDAGWYYNRALGIAAGNGYSEGGLPTAFWPPGWPLLLGGLFHVFGPSVLIVQLFNLACAVLGAWLTLDLGRRIFDSELAGRAGLLLIAVYPNHAAYTPLVLTEVLYTTLTLAGCWLLIVQPRRIGLPLAGLVFGYSMLVKAQSLVLVPLVFAIAAVQEGGAAQAWLRQAGRAAVVLGIAALVVLPWAARNHAVLGAWIPVSTNGGFTLLTGNNPSANGDYTPADALVSSVRRSVATQVADDSEYKRLAVEWIREHPGEFIQLMPRKLFRLWAPDGEAEWAFQAGFASYEQHWVLFRTLRLVNQACYLLLMAGFAWAGWRLFSGRARVGESRHGWWLLPYGMALYVSLIAVVFSGQSRFHYPVMPFVAMVCGWLIIAPRPVDARAASQHALPARH